MCVCWKLEGVFTSLYEFFFFFDIYIFVLCFTLKSSRFSICCSSYRLPGKTVCEILIFFSQIMNSGKSFKIIKWRKKGKKMNEFSKSEKLKTKIKTQNIYIWREGGGRAERDGKKNNNCKNSNGKTKRNRHQHKCKRIEEYKRNVGEEKRKKRNKKKQLWK